MAQRTRVLVTVVLALVVISTTFVVVPLAQEGAPVATMFRDDLKRQQALALSFQPTELPAVGAAPPLQVYLSVGDLERAFDTPALRPSAAIVPTNTGIVITAASPSSQRVLIDRVRRSPAVMTDLQEQIAARRIQAPSKDGNVLEIGTDAFFAELPRKGHAVDAASAFPRLACLIATDYPTGGAVDRRELFVQDRMRKGVAACLAALDAAGASSVMMPLLGAASAKAQTKDAAFEGQRLLKECRYLNAAAGIALGIRDFSAGRHSLREIGIVQWAPEINETFQGGRLAQTAYRLFADQVKQAVSRGLAGGKTTATDVDGNCAATFGT